jgi:phage terminase Nu1 subunit (DNA packaging protein)
VEAHSGTGKAANGMNLYTSKFLAEWLDLSERRVRQLRDEGVIDEERPGAYDLKKCVKQYIRYLRTTSSKGNLTDERVMLTRAKRESVEMENRLRKGELHEGKDIETALKTILLNFRARVLALPAKLSPQLATMGDQQAEIFDLLKRELDEALEELSQYDNALAITEATSHDEDAEEGDREMRKKGEGKRAVRDGGNNTS